MDRAKLASVAETQVGVHEEGGNNCGAQVRIYQSATWLNPGPWAWCAAFVCWCVKEAYHLEPDGNPFFGGLPFEKWRPKTASAVGDYDLEWWAKQHSLKVFDEDAAVERGDIITFDFGHCGIAAGDSLPGSPTVYTIEANTGPAGLADSNNVDGVWRKVRARHLVRRIIRLQKREKP